MIDLGCLVLDANSLSGIDTKNIVFIKTIFDDYKNVYVEMR